MVRALNCREASVNSPLDTPLVSAPPKSKPAHPSIEKELRKGNETSATSCYYRGCATATTMYHYTAESFAPLKDGKQEHPPSTIHGKQRKIAS